MSLLAKANVKQPTITWPILPEDFPLPEDPVEDSSQPLIASALTQALNPLTSVVENALIVSNFALCAGLDERTICKAPDWMFVRPVEAWSSPQPRRSYTPHSQGPVPLVVMEFLSATYGEEYSMEATPKVGKWFFYEQVIQVPTYVIFRGQTGNLEVYDLQNERYRRQTPDTDGHYLIPGINLYLGVWEGRRDLRTGYWLRWWDRAGEMLLWPEEIAQLERQRAVQTEELLERERQRSQALAERLLSLGIDPDQL